MYAIPGRDDDAPSLEIRVCGGDCDPISEPELRRLFPGSALTQARLDRLRELPRVLVMIDGRTVGTATCQKVEAELRVADFAVDGTIPGPRLVGAPRPPREREIVNAMLDAVEIACLAAGCHHIILNPPKVPLGFLERRGYRRVDEQCAGGWVEKRVA